MWWWSTLALAGGGPAHVMVLYNAADSDALAVAEAYAEARDVPSAHLCGLDGLSPEERTLDDTDYFSLVLEPFEACLEALPQPEEIDYLVLVRGLPYRVDLTEGYSASLGAMLQVGRAVDSEGEQLAGQGQQPYSSYYQASVDNPVYVGGTARDGDYTVENAYSGSYGSATRVVRTRKQPRAFVRADVEATGAWDFSGNLFVVSRLDGFDYDDAMSLVDQAVLGDASMPSAPVLCMAAADSARGARDPECEFVTRMVEALGVEGSWLDTHDAALEGYEVAAYFTGAASLTGAIDGQTYVPGALAGNLTSYGAVPNNFFCDDSGETCPESESQTSIARYVRAGVTGVHGTVAEPLNNCFPGAGLLLHYAMGYSMGESYLLHQRYLYWQNILLGDPLVAPWAERPVVTLSDAVALPAGAELTVRASHPVGVEEVRLYLDGVRVDSAESDELTTLIDGSEGDVIEVLAVAVAANETRSVEGWEEDEIVIRSAVQGWTRTVLTLTSPVFEETGTDTAGDTGVQSDTDGTGQPCGCRAGALPWGSGWLWAPLLWGLRRRR